MHLDIPPQRFSLPRAPTPPRRMSEPGAPVSPPRPTPSTAIRLRDTLAAHFTAHRRRGRWSFFWRTTLESLAATIAIALFARIFVDLGERTALNRLSVRQLIVLACVVAPIVETVLLQTLPVALMRAWRQRFWIQVIASAGVFAAPHFGESLGTGLSTGIAGGFYFAFTYVHWREKSLSHAFWMTAGSHATRNTLGVAAILITRYLRAG